MKTDFEDLRKWRRAQVTLAIVLIVQGVTGLVELSIGKGDGIFCWMQNVVLLAFAAVSFCVHRCSGVSVLRKIRDVGMDRQRRRRAQLRQEDREALAGHMCAL